MDERFLQLLRADPRDRTARLIYADWLDERGDPRGAFLRVHLVARTLSPDHAYTHAAEALLSRLRVGLDPAWLAVVEPEGARDGPRDCLRRGRGGALLEPTLHTELQDTECDAWKRVVDAVERAAVERPRVFAPLREFAPEERRRVVTLPPSIGALESVRELVLYGSSLVRLPVEVAAMANLTTFTPYTSYHLHWYPYELARNKTLRGSTVSTRASYGNLKTRLPFPRLARAPLPPELAASARLIAERWPPVRPCSVCDAPFEDEQVHRVWISLRVATDVLGLLVNACSRACIDALPAPAAGHVPRPHRGGASQMPPA